MKNKEKLRKLIFETREKKDIVRAKVCELLKLKGIEYGESSLQRYETGKTKNIKTEVLIAILEILNLDISEVYKLSNENKKRTKTTKEDLKTALTQYLSNEDIPEQDKKELIEFATEIYYLNKV